MRKQNSGCVMNDRDKSREQLIAELENLRQRVGGLEVQLARSQQAEADQRHINNNMPVLVATASLDGYYKEVNAAFERILGWSEQESLSRPFLDFIHPEDRAAAVETFARLKAGTPAVNFLDRNICKDGSHRWINWIVIPVPERDVVFGIGQDVTEKKQVQDELRRSEASWRSVVDNAPVQVTTVDEAGTILLMNRPAPGLTLEHVIGRSVYEFLQPEDCDQARQCLEQVFRTGGTVVNESMATGPHGTRSWYETRLGPVKVDGQVVAVTLISSDITERKRAETAREESERRLKTLISNLPGVVYRCKADSNWTVEFLSDGYASLTGYEPSQLIGQPGTRHSELIHPDDRQREFDVMQEAIAQKRHYQVEYRLRTATGQEKWVWEQGTGIFSEGGELEAIEGFTIDITDRKRAKEELQKINERLEQRIEERTADLTTANELLQAEVQHRRQAEEALRQNEAKYRALVESSPDAVVMVDLQGRIVFASQRAAEQHGVLYPDELIGSQATDFVVEADRDRFRASLGRLIEEGIHRNVEYTLLRKDGTKFDVELSSAVIRDAAGKPESMMAVYRDVSERKKTQEKLAMLGRFAEAAAQGFGMAHVDGQITYVNPFLARLFGAQRPEDVIGTHISNYYPPDYMLRRETEIIPALRRRESWRGEQNMVFPDGRMHTTIHTVFPVLDDKGKLLYAAAVITDITELAQTQEALSQSNQQLRASEERFELVVRASGVGIWDWDLRTGKAYFSPRCKTLIGYDENEIIDSFEDWASRLHPDEREWIFTAAGRVPRRHVHDYDSRVPCS